MCEGYAGAEKKLFNTAQFSHLFGMGEKTLAAILQNPMQADEDNEADDDGAEQ